MTRPGSADPQGGGNERSNPTASGNFKPQLVLPDPACDLDPDICAPALISRQAKITPGAPAIVAGEDVLTYADLDARSAELASHLSSLGARRESVVGLCFERSIAMIVGALGIMKAGAAYLPLDPSHPKVRLAFQLDDARAEILVCAHGSESDVPPSHRPLVQLRADGRVAGEAVMRPFSTAVQPEDLAYAIYTSGSSGHPKGVEITHGSLLNLISWHRSAFSVTENDRASHVSGVGFDAAVWELWPNLAAGCSVHIVEDPVVKDPARLRNWLLAHGITISFVPTPLAERLMSLMWPSEVPLRFMLTGAETLHKYPPASLPFRLVNNYGPTECTVVATSAVIDPAGHKGQLPPIGRPIANTQVHIFDECMQPVAPGEEGEICIAGRGLARGYRGHADLTAEKFVSNPFGPSPTARLYRSGDRGRLLPDGQIAFLGRIDDQVSLRGYRIELAEIEAVLNRHPFVRESIAAVREFDPEGKQLLAYVVLHSETLPTPTELRAFIANYLPDYMIPSAFIRVVSLPLKESGKIHRQALPAPTVENTLAEGVRIAPRTPLEKRLAEIVTSLLGIDEVGVEDNFFMLGGHSLFGTQVIARVSDAFGIEISLRYIFESPTIAGLAAEVERKLRLKIEALSEEEAQQLLVAKLSAARGSA